MPAAAAIAGRVRPRGNVPPCLSEAAVFGLSDGVDKLRELAGLPAITPAAPVNFTLTYTR